MSNTKFPQLASAPPPLPYRYAHFLRHPNDTALRDLVEFPSLTMQMREFLALQQAKPTRDQAARTLAVIGRPGEGKTLGLLAAALNEGYSVCSTAASMYASENEGGADKVLDAVLAELQRWSAEHKQRTLLQTDDIDLSIMAADDKTGVSINTKLLIERFHYLADNRHLYRNYDGSNIGLVVTLNDGSKLRESLYRPGRAIWYEHVPTAEDKRNIAWAILKPKTSAERDLVVKLTAKFAHQPIAFWKSLALQMQATHARRVLATGIPDAATLNAQFAGSFPLTPDIAWSCARTLRANRARSWLSKRPRLLQLIGH